MAFDRNNDEDAAEAAPNADPVANLTDGDLEEHCKHKIAWNYLCKHERGNSDSFKRLVAGCQSAGCLVDPDELLCNALAYGNAGAVRALLQAIPDAVDEYKKWHRERNVLRICALRGDTKTARAITEQDVCTRKEAVEVCELDQDEVSSETLRSLVDPIRDRFNIREEPKPRCDAFYFASELRAVQLYSSVEEYMVGRFGWACRFLDDAGLQEVISNANSLNILLPPIAAVSSNRLPGLAAVLLSYGAKKYAGILRDGGGDHMAQSSAEILFKDSSIEAVKILAEHGGYTADEVRESGVLGILFANYRDEVAAALIEAFGLTPEDVAAARLLGEARRAHRIAKVTAAWRGGRRHEIHLSNVFADFVPP